MDTIKRNEKKKKPKIFPTKENKKCEEQKDKKKVSSISETQHRLNTT